MRCYFHLVNGQETIPDDTGVEVSDLATAKAQAHEAISELRREFAGAIEDWGGWRLDIVGPDGNLLYSYPLSKALH